jgi:hypothetical protein
LRRNPVPKVAHDTETNSEKSGGWGSPSARIEVAEAAMNLARIDRGTFAQLRASIERLIVDPHPAVRHSITIRLGALWENDRPLMWDLAIRHVQLEKNRNVLAFFASYFIGRIIHHDPAKAEMLALQLLNRFGDAKREPNQKLLEQLGGIFALLWGSHGRANARDVLINWLKVPDAHVIEIDHALSATRDGLILGYDTGTPGDIAIRQGIRAAALGLPAGAP